MTERERQQVEMLVRVRNFGSAHGQLFPETNPAHAAFTVIAVEVERLEALAGAERTATTNARAAGKNAARAALTRSLMRAGSTARVLEPANPVLQVRLTTKLRISDRLLLTIGREFVTNAAPYASQFEAHGIRLAPIESQLTAFDQACQDRGRRREDGAKASAAIAESMARVKAALKTLDVTVANRLAEDPVTLAAWQLDRKVEYRKPRTAAAPETTETSEPGGTQGTTTPAIAA